MSRAEVDHLEPIFFLLVIKHDEAVGPPYLFLSGVFSIVDLRLEIRAIRAVEISPQGSLARFSGDPLRGGLQLHLLAQVATRFLDAPHERTRADRGSAKLAKANIEGLPQTHEDRQVESAVSLHSGSKP